LSSSDKANDPVAVVIDRSLLGYLAAASKEDSNIVMCNLRDLATTVVDRLRNRTYGYGTWGNVIYPNINLKLKVTVNYECNGFLRQRVHAEHYEKFTKDTGVSMRGKLPKGLKKKDRYDMFSKWIQANPWPKLEPEVDAKYFMAVFKIAAESQIMMTQDEIDTVLVEQILLLPPEDIDE
jgi:hypothetical protein